MRYGLLVLLAAASVSCGPERLFSGRWQQVCGEEAPCPGDRAYELHLGRYGDGAAGLLVRYATSPRVSGVDVFDPPNECGCFYISGGKATDAGVKFTLFEPDAPGRPGDDFEWSRTCVPPGTAAPPPERDDCVFDLSGDDETLTADEVCEGRVVRTLIFGRVGSSSRTNCAVPDP